MNDDNLKMRQSGARQKNDDDDLDNQIRQLINDEVQSARQSASASAAYTEFTEKMRWFAFIAIVIITAFLIYLIFFSSVSGSSAATGASGLPTSFMTLFLTVAAGSIAYLASAMGMRRLEKYDDQFAAFREERRDFEKKMLDKINEQFNLRLQLNIEVSQRIEEGVRSALEGIEDEKEKVLEAIEKIDQNFSDHKSKLLEIQSYIDKKFGFLVESSSVSGYLKDSPSVADIHRRVSKLFRDGDAAEASRLVRAMLSDRLPQNRIRLRATGDEADWFNLGAVLGQNDEFELGLQVNLAGLQQMGMFEIDNELTMMNLDRMPPKSYSYVGRWPPNVDMLSHAINYGNKLGLTKIVEDLIVIASEVPRESRNWRYYQFVGDYYSNLGDEYKGKFDALVAEFQERIPEDERSVGLEIDWYMKRGKISEALEIGRDWLESHREYPRRVRGNAVPMKLAMASIEAGRYEDALRFTESAIEGGADPQPNASIEALMYYRATAFDSLLIETLKRESLDVDGARTLYANAKRLYSSKLVQSRQTFSAPALSRISVMTLMMQEKGCIGGEHDEPDTEMTDDVSPQAAMALVSEAVAVAHAGSKDDVELIVDKLNSHPHSEALKGVILQISEDTDMSDENRAAAKRILEVFS